MALASHPPHTLKLEQCAGGMMLIFMRYECLGHSHRERKPSLMWTEYFYWLSSVSPTLSLTFWCYTLQFLQDWNPITNLQMISSKRVQSHDPHLWPIWAGDCFILAHKIIKLINIRLKQSQAQTCYKWGMRKETAQVLRKSSSDFHWDVSPVASWLCVWAYCKIERQCFWTYPEYHDFKELLIIYLNKNKNKSFWEIWQK